MLQTANPTRVCLEASTDHLFSSFDRFKKAGAKALETLTNGFVGTLNTKTGMYRIVTEQDFQELVGALETSRHLQNELRMVIEVAHTYVEHKDASSFRSLESVLITVSESPGFKRQEGHGELPFEESDSVDDEGYIFDPALLQSQAAGH